MQQVEQQGRRADEDVWKIGRVNLTEVTRQKPILGETVQSAGVQVLSLRPDRAIQLHAEYVPSQ